jgi:hypothetical protein
MHQMRSKGFVGADTLELRDVGAGVLRMRGEIACSGGLVVDVRKFLEVLDGEGQDARVQTFEYKYNAFVRGGHNVLRYDNTHPYPGHADAHHKHVYDRETGRQVPGSPFWIGADRWPTLGEVLDELERWYWENRDDLPEGFPSLGVRG